MRLPSIDYARMRIFTVNFERGAVTSDPIDIYGQKGKFTAYLLSFAVTVSDGELNIDFSPIFQNPQICGIEIRRR
jgi:hypothetical protein